MVCRGSKKLGTTDFLKLYYLVRAHTGSVSPRKTDKAGGVKVGCWEPERLLMLLGCWLSYLSHLVQATHMSVGC